MTTFRQHPTYEALRASAAIHHQLVRRHHEEASVLLPDRSFGEAQRLVRQIHRAHRHGWPSAAHLLTARLRSALEDCHYRLIETLASLRQRTSAPAIPTETELSREILALQREFDEVELEAETGEIRVTVGPIVLEGIDLGRFQICLDWEPSRGPSPYYILALDPNPTSSNPEVSHPHVQDQQLCEGEGRAAIREALLQGRLYDFFLVVSQILSTYARGSAYVELDEWHGQRCTDCGGIVDEEESYTCCQCEAVLCRECVTTCPHCDRDYCSSCISACEVCRERSCAACLEECSVCHRAVCPNCLEEGLCGACHETREQELDERELATDEDDTRETSEAEASFPSRREGEPQDVSAAQGDAAV